MIRLATGFALVIAVLIFLADTRNLGPLMVLYDFPYGDKVGHVLLYGGLTFFACLAVYRAPAREPWRAAILVTGAMLVLVSLEELSQLFFPARKPDLFDLLASYGGVLWFATLALVIGELQRSGRSLQRIPLPRFD